MTHAPDVDALLRAWLSARSIARGLPAPVPDRGGLRVDTNGPTEIRRWVFHRIVDSLVELGRAIDAPGHMLKACVPDGDLRAALPDRWRLHAPGFFMMAAGAVASRPTATGYGVTTDRTDAVVEVQVRTSGGEVAARGFGAETDSAFVYDRIETMAAHRRKGLGGAVMAALDHARSDRAIPALLVATREGHALYSTLGWRTITPYATASIAEGG